MAQGWAHLLGRGSALKCDMRLQKNTSTPSRNEPTSGRKVGGAWSAKTHQSLRVIPHAHPANAQKIPPSYGCRAAFHSYALGCERLASFPLWRRNRDGI